jgi:S-adenosylmethionine-dependent methyltransferase
MAGTSIHFDRNVEGWLHYSGTLKGRLRHELTWRHLEKHIRSVKGKMRVFDAGCGLGEMAFQLLEKAAEIVVLDFSEDMLMEAKKRFAEDHSASDRDRRIFIHGRVEELEHILPQGSFDLILCHNLLEYVEDPRAVLTKMVQRLAPQGLLSLVAANRFGEVFKLALVKKNLEQARMALHEKNSTAELFDNAPKHIFSLEDLEEMADGSGLDVLNRYGIRIFSDYLPEEVMKEPGNERLLFELEKEAATLAPYLHAARYLQLICRKKTSDGTGSTE